MPPALHGAPAGLQTSVERAYISDVRWHSSSRVTPSVGAAADISFLSQEFTEALTEVLAENAAGPARRGRLARARAAVKKHLKYSEHEYFLAVEAAFLKWEAIQNVGR